MHPHLGLIGIEPITSRYERDIFPLNYRIWILFENHKKENTQRNILLVRVN